MANQVYQRVALLNQYVTVGRGVLSGLLLLCSLVLTGCNTTPQNAPAARSVRILIMY